MSRDPVAMPFPRAPCELQSETRGDDLYRAPGELPGKPEPSAATRKSRPPVQSPQSRARCPPVRDPGCPFPRPVRAPGKDQPSTATVRVGRRAITASPSLLLCQSETRRHALSAPPCELPVTVRAACPFRPPQSEGAVGASPKPAAMPRPRSGRASRRPAVRTTASPSVLSCQPSRPCGDALLAPRRDPGKTKHSTAP
ncbi:uncharacterized protein K441DRAFT_681939 [Cenococcum geophilum 1.58]|uniref:Uncharacterized protein n=1 Tax=Cenococcum geophilum 1.58 TaxID=794803 RepID=A0ACC8EPG0_9PEZI|nr:hypothetical protein K441DRAFT_681939 [Cenococcum geophilum 1.58]